MGEIDKQEKNHKVIDISSS